MTSQQNTSHRLRDQMIGATFARMVINTAHRMIYPFLPAFSRGLGVPVEALAVMLSARGALGLASPLFGPIPDRFGRRNAMVAGVAVFTLGLAVVAIWPGYATLFAAMMLIVVSKFLFDPALQAYIGDRTPYSRRGLVIAFTEMAWSGAVLIGTPLIGYAIALSSWRAPFAPLAVLGVFSGLLIWYLIPANGTREEAAATRPPLWKQLSLIWRSPSILGALAIGTLISIANESFGVVYGVWMEQSFALSVVQLGLTTTVIGLAELGSEALVMFTADKMGKRRAIAMGLGASAVAYSVLPFVSVNLNWALAAIFFVYVAFEYTIVASIPLMTELLPEARGTMMSANMASHALGRMIGALLGGTLYRLGFAWNGIGAAVLSVVGIPLILWIVKESKGDG